MSDTKFLLSKLRSEIAEHCSSLEEVQAILRDLSLTDWGEYSDTLTRVHCHNYICKAFVLPEELLENPKSIKKEYCVRCKHVVEARYSYPCDCCGLLYDRSNESRIEICGKCVDYDTLCQVERNLSRASSKNLPATLTVRQWLATLKHFDHCCAYCGAQQTYFEHYVPITRGGGTTQTNSLPTCNRCNLIKGNRLPEKFESKFPKERIDAIKAYQDAILSTPPVPHAFQKGDFVINNVSTSPYYKAVGQIDRVHEWLLGYDANYGDGVMRKVWGEEIRWVRRHVFELEANLIPTGKKYFLDHLDGIYAETQRGITHPELHAEIQTWFRQK